MNDEIIVISMGGSIIYPAKDTVDHALLERYKTLFAEQVKLGKRFIIITGGGYLARQYQEEAKAAGRTANEELDWVGIRATHENAERVRALLAPYTPASIIKDPSAKIDFKEKILVSGGWKPGFSSDYDAVLLAEQFGAKEIINLTNIDYVYDKDPNKFKDAKPYKSMSWKQLESLLPKDWKPGMNAPFDPIASRLAEKNKMTVYIINGKSTNNLDNLLNHKEYVGTRIN